MGFRSGRIEQAQREPSARITDVSARLEANVGRAFAERKGTVHKIVRMVSGLEIS
jgi:hypothetical protein